MSQRSNSPPSPTKPRRRRSSFTELFQKQGNVASPTTGSHPRPIYTPSSARTQQQRRMSLNTLGLSGSPTQMSPFAAASMRRGSVSSSVMSTSPTMDQAVVEEAEEETPTTAPATPFARRVSFGAPALRGSGNGTYHPLWNARSPRNRSSSLFGNTSPNSDGVVPSATEGFNWPESLRVKAERAPSLGNFPPTSPTLPHAGMIHQRSASIAAMEAPPPERAELPKQSQHKSRPKPDYFQEKILRADFMD
uniref:Uncharacterized protein n=1 Tax=Coccidioides posadasii RMSCC 3488 TaxID=454284 RepID=A0A0J6F9N9_COCPO|nr:hypothetical protein CPAG_06050 [Coccidioides posadasii RMSCC 3488]